LPDNPDKILWNEARLAIGITDLKGVDKINRLEWNSDSLNPEGGVPYESSLSTGVSAPINIVREQNNSFTVELDLKGSEAMFSFLPENPPG
jgi:inner membrane protein